MKTSELNPGGLLTLASALAVAFVLAGPVALAENPPDTQKSEIDPNAPGDPAGLSPRGDYKPAQADKGTAEQHAEAIEKDALTPDKPADAGVDDLNKQQEQEEQQTAAPGSGDVPKAYAEQRPTKAAPQTEDQQRSANAAASNTGTNQQSASAASATDQPQQQTSQPRG